MFSNIANASLTLQGCGSEGMIFSVLGIDRYTRSRHKGKAS